MACLSGDEHVDFIRNDLRGYKIDYSHCPMIEGTGCPVATIILNSSTGSRTIVYHDRGLPELTFKNFELLNLEEYSWIHFEGRNVDQVLLMIKRIRDYNDSLNCTHDHATDDRVPITISVEFESPRAGPRLLDLLPYVDVAFIAKEFAGSLGFNNMNEIIRNIGQSAKATIICAWAEDGAIACTPCGVTIRSTAFPPRRVIDTLGAGDTFNAAALYYLNKSKIELIREYKDQTDRANNELNRSKNDTSNNNTIGPDVEENLDIKDLEYRRTKFITETVLQKTIRFACYVAGAKVGLRGYNGLDVIVKDILQQDCFS
ncbi:ketohexokinase-like isoform X2 [Pogonomyrmex barbatus]|nr:ketohexokinase-like isoform X2 [Pogonomyrmex barbatus]